VTTRHAEESSGGDTPARGGARRAYHHGDLRNALIDAATELARTGGPDAIVLREVARLTGVSSTAAYRHFDNHADLVEAVKHRGMEMMADSVRAEIAAGEASDDPVSEAARRICATGLGYIRFALAEPGLFRVVFRQYHGSTGAGRTAVAVNIDVPPPVTDQDTSYAIMSDALDELVAHGALPPERRPFTDVALWAAVHGLSVLFLDTDLAMLPEPAREAAIERLLDVVFHGIAPRPTG
jgi:AcrR family transcriptional regulator